MTPTAAVIRGTSAGEAVAIRRALEEQRERIASEVEALGCINYGCSFADPHGHEIDHGRHCPVGIAAMIRTGKD